MTNQTTSIYLLSNDQNIHWGLTVSTVGYQHIAPGEAYPPKGHPQAYSFQAGRGRVLDEYQFVYISRGCGVFESKSFGQATVGEGDLRALHPLSIDYGDTDRFIDYCCRCLLPVKLLRAHQQSQGMELGKLQAHTGCLCLVASTAVGR